MIEIIISVISLIVSVYVFRELRKIMHYKGKRILKLTE